MCVLNPSSPCCVSTLKVKRGSGMEENFSSPASPSLILLEPLKPSLKVPRFDYFFSFSFSLKQPNFYSFIYFFSSVLLFFLYIPFSRYLTRDQIHQIHITWYMKYLSLFHSIFLISLDRESTAMPLT